MEATQTPRSQSYHDGIIDKQPKTAKNVTLYKNGDQYFGGRRFVINQRQLNNMDSFLEYATDALKPSFGAVRNIYTPESGTRIKSLEEIQSGRAYVVGGNENFRNLGSKKISLKYSDIGMKKPREIKKTYSHIKPVSHNTAFNQVSGRWKQVANEINHPIQLWLHVNGDSQSSPVRLLLPSRVLKLKWDMILEYVTDKVGIRLGHAVRRMFTCDGDVMTSAKALITGRTYVACGSGRFQNMTYRTGGTQIAPVLKRKPMPLIGVKKRRQRSPDHSQEKEQYDDLVNQMQNDRSQPKPTKAKNNKKQAPPAPAQSTPVKSNSIKKKAGAKLIQGSEYVDEDPNMKTDVPVEMQKAKQVAKKKGNK